MSIRVNRKETETFVCEKPYFEKLTQNEVIFPKEIQFAKNEHQIQIRNLKGGGGFFKDSFLGSNGMDIFITSDEIELKSFNEKFESIKIRKEQIKDIFIQRCIIDRGRDGRDLYYVIMLILKDPISLPSLDNRANVFNFLGFNFKSLFTARFIIQEIIDMLKIKSDDKEENNDIYFINFDSIEENDSSLTLKKPPFLGYCVYSLLGFLLAFIYFIQDPNMKNPSTPWLLGICSLVSIIALIVTAFLNMGFYLNVSKNQIKFSNILPWGAMATPKDIILRTTSIAKVCEIKIEKRLDRGNDIGWFEVRLFPDSFSKESQIIASAISFEEAEYIAYTINRIIADKPMDNKFHAKIAGKIS